MYLNIKLKNGQELQLNESFLTSFRYQDMVTNGEEIRIGVAPSATLEFNAINRDNVLSNKKFENCVIEYYDDDNKKVGVFDCEQPKKNKKSIDFEPVDRMMKFEVDWRGSSFPITTYNLLLNICNQCGISLRTLKEDIINSDITIQEENGLAGETCRTILKYLCEVFGSYANMNANGELTIDYYDFKNVKDTINYGDCTYFEIDEKESKRAGVLFKNNKENVQVGDTSCSYIIENNPIIAQQSESVKNEIGTRIVERIKYTSLKGGEFTLSKRKLKEGDVIKVVEENGDENICVVSKIVFENLNKMTIYSYADTQNTNNSTSTSTSSTTDTDTYSKEIYLGRGQNHQRIIAKSGTYTLAEKLITNITSFSKVNLNLFINFNYNLNKILFFDIFANDKLVKSLKYDANIGFNQFSVGFLADIDLEQENNIFSCKITLEEGDILEIEPFECQMSFIVKSCKITDAVAADQYFVEKYNKIDNIIFNQNRFSIKNLRERITIKIPFYSFDISKNSDKSVMADWYEDGTMEIYGEGETQDTQIWSIAFWAFNKDINVHNTIKNNTIKLYIYGDIVLNSKLFMDCVVLEEINFNNYNVSVGSQCFVGCTNLTTLIGERNIYYVGWQGFRNCNLTGTYDFSNCSDIRDSAFENNSNMNYIKLPIPLTKGVNVGMENCFLNCSSLDSIIVLNKDLACDHTIHATAFKNSQISTFMLTSDVQYTSFSYVKNLATTNPTLYICSTYPEQYYSQLTELEETYGFNIIWYDADEEENLLNELRNR